MRSSAFGETNPIFSSKPNGRGSCLVRFCGFRAETNPAFADDTEAVPGSATMFAKRTLLVFYNDINVRPSRLVSYRSQPERPVHSLFGRKPSLLRRRLSLFRPPRETARNALALLHELTSAGVKMAVKIHFPCYFPCSQGMHGRFRFSSLCGGYFFAAFCCAIKAWT
jgi:hypothetical protein